MLNGIDINKPYIGTKILSTIINNTYKLIFKKLITIIYIIVSLVHGRGLLFSITIGTKKYISLFESYF